MKLPRLDMGAVREATFERALSESWARRPQPLGRRDARTEWIAAAALLLAALAIGVFFSSDHELDVLLAAAYVIAFALAARVRFEVGAGFTTPVQLVFIPMLFALPHAVVPIAVALGFALAKLPDALAGRVHPDRLLVALGDAWFSVGPAAVFAAAHIGAPSWGDIWIYVGALAAQFAADTIASTARVWGAMGIPPRFQIGPLIGVYLVDALLTPIGLLAAFAAQGAPYRAFLVLPLIALLAVFAQEREAHIESALQLSTAYRGTALLLGDVLEDKDAYTASHSHGVVSLSLMVSDKLRLDPAERRRVEFGALLHDIGKIAVPAEIINKPGPLDDEEWAVMKLHTVEGQAMLDRVGGVLAEVGRVVRSSHEHYDGTGYPDGLAGEAIPIEARIVSCCDAFSAMTTNRSYRKAMSLEAAREELRRNSGSQFDPEVVAALIEVLHEERVRVHRPLPHESEVARIS
jgi:HD-GYP domain-containing protein (c-di-GMP phosphodiesterase class II)